MIPFKDYTGSFGGLYTLWHSVTVSLFRLGPVSAYMRHSDLVSTVFIGWRFYFEDYTNPSAIFAVILRLHPAHWPSIPTRRVDGRIDFCQSLAGHVTFDDLHPVCQSTSTKLTWAANFIAHTRLMPSFASLKKNTFCSSLATLYCGIQGVGCRRRPRVSVVQLSSFAVTFFRAYFERLGL